MIRFASFFHKSIPARLFRINALIFFTFIGITLSVHLAFRYIENKLGKIFASEVDLVIENAQVGRRLGQIVADTNLLASHFYGKPDFLEAEGDKLISETDVLIPETGNDLVKASLSEFSLKLRNLLEQCERVNHTREELRIVIQEVRQVLAALDETVSEKTVNLMINAQDASSLERLSFAIAGFLETLLLMDFRFAELGLNYFKSPRDEKDHPILSLLNDLHLGSRTLTAYEPDIAAFGPRLVDGFEKYRRAIGRFHEDAGELDVRMKETEGKKRN